jgi:hypothetical protein
MSVVFMTRAQALSATTKAAQAAHALLRDRTPQNVIRLRTLCDYLRPNMYEGLEDIAELLARMAKLARDMEKGPRFDVSASKPDLEAALKGMQAAMDACRVVEGLSSEDGA